MPYDLNTLERGYGECEIEWPLQSGQYITLRYHANLNSRALAAMGRLIFGRESADKKLRFPDVEGIMEHLERTLLPIDHEYGPGWDITDNGQPVPITEDTLLDLPMELPGAMLAAIANDVRDPNRRKPSRNGSFRGVSSEPTPSPITTDSSLTPNGQASLPGPLQDATIPPAGLVGAIGYAR